MSFPTRNSTLEHDFARLSLRTQNTNPSPQHRYQNQPPNSNTANCNTTALQKIDDFQGKQAGPNQPRYNNPYSIDRPALNVSDLERRYPNPGMSGMPEISNGIPFKVDSNYIPFFDERAENLSKLEIAHYYWLNQETQISDGTLQKVNYVAVYLKDKGFELMGVQADGNSFCNAFLGSYETLSREIPILDSQADKISLLRAMIAQQYLTNRKKSQVSADTERTEQIKQNGEWLTTDEGDLLATILDIPIRIIVIYQDKHGHGVKDMLSEKNRARQDWNTIDDYERPREYILIVDIGNHFLYAQPLSKEKKGSFSASLTERKKDTFPRCHQNPIPVVNTNSSSQKTCKMEVSKIRFTQQTVSPYFSDGITKVETLAQQLARGEVLAKDIPSIRVVRHKNQLWSLDNRRLRAFKDGLVETIDVMMVDLKDPNIAKEFWDKLSSKSATESGIIRKETLTNAQLFESPIYVFTKIVLNWTFEQIELPMPSYKKTPLPDSYNHRSTYYKSFEPLIFEEARAILHTGIQEASAEQKSRFRFSLTNLKAAKKADNASEIKFSVLPGSEKDMKSGDVLLFENKKNPNVRLIALTIYNPQGIASSEFSFRAVINTDLLQKYRYAFEKGEEWEAKALGSLVTLQRMYEACQNAQGMQPTSLENSIINGHNESSSRFGLGLQNLRGRYHLGLIHEPISEYLGYSSKATNLQEVDFQASGLNPSQIETITKFLQLPEGLFLVQGPPGTGKTTTIIQLLSALQQQGKKVLVCAPANKAVQILAKRFMDKFPKVPIILVGAEDPPPDSTLNDIFMDSWHDRQKLVLTQIGETILDLQLHKLIAGDAKFFSSRLENAYETLVGTIKKFSSFVENIEKYELTCLKELDLQQAKFEEAIGHYWELISSEEFPWEETALYYAKKEDALIEMPSHVSLARSYLSKISIILSSLQEQLQIAESNETSTGLQAELLNHSQLIFCTLSVSGQQRMKNITSINTLIVDEAGQATEAETLIPLTIANPQKCLLIGDIKQLPATVISQDAEKLKFGRSMMERLIRDCDYPYAMLDTQYRMHPEISRWPSQHYYGGELKNHSSVCAPEHAIKGMEKSFPFLGPYAFINMNGKEQKGPLGRSFFNQTEVKSIALIIDYLAKSCLIKVEEHVAVISFYAEQINQINTALKSKYPNIRVNTVDGFQGGESDIIIISCVRANLDKQIGFLKDAKRLNVALTRAKFSLIILGNKPTLMRSDIAELVADADERKVLFEEEVLQKLVVKKPVIQKQKNTTNNYPALYQSQPQSLNLDCAKSPWLNDRKPPNVRNPRGLPIVKPRDPLADAGERKVLSEEGVLQKSVNKPVIQKQNNKTNNFPELCQNQPQSSHLDHSKSPWLNDRKPPSIRNPGEPAILEPREPSRGPKPKFVTGSDIIKLNRKTELCRNYALNTCRFGNQCDFAHGAAELNQGTKKLEPKRVSSYSKK